MTAATTSVQGLTDLAAVLQTAEGFPEMLASLRAGHGATVDGAWGSSAALAIAALTRHSDGPVLVTLAHPRDLDPWAADLASFSGIEPVVFPAWDNAPSDTDSLDDTAAVRLRLLKQLESEAPPRLLLCSFQALLQPVPDRAQLLQRRRVLRVGDAVDPDALAGWLVDHG